MKVFGRTRHLLLAVVLACGVCGKATAADIALRPSMASGEVHQIDIAATVSRLLGIDPPLQSEGVPIL